MTQKSPGPNRACCVVQSNPAGAFITRSAVRPAASRSTQVWSATHRARAPPRLRRVGQHRKHNLENARCHQPGLGRWTRRLGKRAAHPIAVWVPGGAPRRLTPPPGPPPQHQPHDHCRHEQPAKHDRADLAGGLHHRPEQGLEKAPDRNRQAYHGRGEKLRDTGSAIAAPGPPAKRRLRSHDRADDEDGSTASVFTLSSCPRNRRSRRGADRSPRRLGILATSAGMGSNLRGSDDYMFKGTQTPNESVMTMVSTGTRLLNSNVDRI